MQLKNTPFRHVIVSSFLQTVQPLLGAIQPLHFSLKQSDLFTFFQTNDLTNSKIKEIQQFKQTIIGLEFIKQLEQTFDVKLTGNIDIFASLYKQTHYLLPHDDQLEGRKLAYILYLSDMDEQDGGALCLYDNIPQKVTTKIQPKVNTLVVFKVSEKSFHEVQEVLKGDRISLTGWFY